MVVADNISASRKTGMVPKTAMATMDQRPNFKELPIFKSIAANFENEEKVESNVEAAEVIMIKLIINNKTTPKAFPTSTAACPLIPCDWAYTPMILNNTIQSPPSTLAQRKLLSVTLGLLRKPLSVSTGSWNG